MNILISNDDGILARGLGVLADVCRTVGSVTVVAPDREQSGASHSLTLDRPLRPSRRPDGSLQVDGTPTDCVLLALGVLLDEKPDYVFSGINHGPNMGEDVLYSGTVAAAMEGLSLGIPGVAISLAGNNVELLDSHRPWLERLVADIVKVKEFPKETLLNVNLPPIPGAEIQGIRVTTLGKRVYSESLVRTKDPWGRTGYWIGGGQISWSGREDSDFRAIQDHYISVTPLHVDLTNYGLLEDVTGWQLGA
ncbi:MAG: 5'/3'-nucleotidase SurE [Gemmatimonadales bacterium]|nr:5'/3'-nucleotidase SurE [Gemmatimonadales bacterium]NIN11985.1 5'/3'-nucleotidase SurE [Gemmatimonadales bacterium]NIN50520.1 5'/3'-nucleotidase SurE [Gemmatimonadales bacterium]NIP07984.1 5'/3'-nucleotidase SurE [Gemmatimonadales bacterium]NIR00575.1 5'/3'-nucleotidase SurE [Gemmatimonadales bacterium]